jgi:hypothetical protein
MVWSLSLDEEAVSSAFCFATSSAFWFFPSISETRCTYCSEASPRALEPGSQSTLIEHLTDLFLYFFLHGSTITPHFKDVTGERQNYDHDDKAFVLFTIMLLRVWVARL